MLIGFNQATTLKSISDLKATVELFNPEYWKLEPEKAIKTAKEKTEDVIKMYYR